MGSSSSKTSSQKAAEKANRRMENLVGPGYRHMAEDKDEPPPPVRPKVTTQAKLRQPSSDTYFSGTKPTITRPTPANRPTQSSKQTKAPNKPESKNYNHPTLKGQDNVKLVGPGADPSKNKAWMGDVKDVPRWGPGMLPAMCPASEVGKGRQRLQEGVARLKGQKK